MAKKMLEAMIQFRRVRVASFTSTPGVYVGVRVRSEVFSAAATPPFCSAAFRCLLAARDLKVGSAMTDQLASPIATTEKRKKNIQNPATTRGKEWEGSVYQRRRIRTFPAVHRHHRCAGMHRHCASRGTLPSRYFAATDAQFRTFEQPRLAVKSLNIPSVSYTCERRQFSAAVIHLTLFRGFQIRSRESTSDAEVLGLRKAQRQPLQLVGTGLRLLQRALGLKSLYPMLFGC